MFSPGKCQRLQNKPDISLQKPHWVLVSGALLDKSHFTVSERRDAHFALGTVYRSRFCTWGPRWLPWQEDRQVGFPLRFPSERALGPAQPGR